MEEKVQNELRKKSLDLKNSQDKVCKIDKNMEDFIDVGEDFERDKALLEGNILGAFYYNPLVVCLLTDYFKAFQTINSLKCPFFIV